MRDRSEKIGFGKIFGMLLAFLSVVAVLAVALIATNYERFKELEVFAVSEYVEPEGAEMAAADQLQVDLLARYPAEEIQTKIQIRNTMRGTTRSLLIEFFSPEFTLEQPDPRSLAREISVEIAAFFPEIGRYEKVAIAFVEPVDSVIAFRTHENYWFDTRELVGGAEDPTRPEAEHR